MPSVEQGSRSVFSLQPGATLRVAADADSSGIVRRLSTQPGSQASGVQQQDVPAGGDLSFGPFPGTRRYSVECTVGSLSFTTDVNDYAFASLRGNVEGFVGDRTLREEDMGKILRCDDASAVVVTVPLDLPEGFNVGLAAWDVGSLTVTAASGATNRSSTSALSQYGLGSVIVMKNSDGQSAEFKLGGEFA